MTVDPPADIELEIEVEREDGDVSFETEMEWPEEAGDVDTDARASRATFELYEDSVSEWWWRLVHDNGNLIADSGEGYSSKRKAKQGLRSVKRNIMGAPVEETD